MPRANHSITLCLIFLGLAVLVRTVAIAQRACDVLLPPMSCDYRGPAIAAVAIGRTNGSEASYSAEPPATINAPVVNIPPVVNVPSVEDPPPEAAAENPPEGSASQAKGQAPRQIASETQRKKIARRQALRRYYDASSSQNNGYSYRSYRSGFAFQ